MQNCHIFNNVNGLLKEFSSLPLEFNPGSSWAYANSNYTILGAVIIQMSETSLYNSLLKDVAEVMKVEASNILKFARKHFCKTVNVLSGD